MNKKKLEHTSVPVHGILLLDKPLNMTSNAALQKIKRLFGAKKAGHTGSLDPLATGMLPLCFGEATKLSQFLLDSDKYYRVSLCLGVKTTTGDAEGEVIETRSAENITQSFLEKILSQFVGKQLQVPPMYSAIKYKGQPLYKLARKGIEVERQPREVHIYFLQLENFQDQTVSLYVHCSKGTYIRTLAEDIGEQLGCGAHVSHLRRVAVSPYKESKMVTLTELFEMHEQHGQDALRQWLLPLDTVAEAFPKINLSSASAFYLRTGQAVRVPGLPMQGLVRLFSDGGEFIGIGEILEDGRVTPKRLLNFSRPAAVM